MIVRLSGWRHYYASVDTTVFTLLSKLSERRVFDAEVIRWGAPVPSFGDAARSQVATLGLNPSNREFVDGDGNELRGEMRRFHTLRSLGLKSWKEARGNHVEMIVDSCRSYFNGNPYDAWFRQLDHIISGTRASYYSDSTSACHLDLIPFATSRKWTDLTRSQRSTLLEVSVGELFNLLRDSPINVLVLNGRSVVDHLEKIAAIKLTRREMRKWSLRRGTDGAVSGHSYRGSIRELGGVDMGREILILGFNHNIQSSFGVTNEVRLAIRDWIAGAVLDAGL